MIIANIHQPYDTVDITFEFNELIEGKEWSHKMTFNSSKYGVIVKDY